MKSKLLLVACCVLSLQAEADQGKIDPKSWRPDGPTEVWRDFGGGLALKEIPIRCNPRWDGHGVRPCGVNYWTHFDRHPEWYPEVFFPPGPNYGNIEPIDGRGSVPEPSRLLILGIGLVALWRMRESKN